jgi:hypothetical protein
MKKILIAAALIATLATSAQAGDVLWYLGHAGNDEGHADIVALLSAEGAVVDVVSSDPLPDLSSYTLVFLSLPGFFDAGAFFSADEKARINSWLAVGSHRIVPIGEWDGFYAGQDVMEDLLAAIGNPIVFVPGAWDASCGHCAGPLGDPDPITAGLSHVCYAFTATWDPSFGVPLAYPEDPAAPGPYIVSNGTDVPCIVGIGDANITSDPCGYLSAAGGDADTKTFHQRLYQITCAGEPQFACCLSTGECQLLTEADCMAAGGAFHPEMGCNETLCRPTATEGKSWGTVKTIFK